MSADRRRVQLVDCTLREGDQAPGVWLDGEDKQHLFGLLDDAGVAVVDAGMPVVSPREEALVRALARRESRRARVAASVRAREDELALAADCGVDDAFVIYPVSVQHREQRLGLDRDAWLELGRRVVRAGRELGLTVDLVLEDASRAERADVAAAVELAVEAGAERVMICDTVGVLTPTAASALTRDVVAISAGRVGIGTHFHDDFGMATANTLAAVEAGAGWPSVTVNGVGERAGNAVLAEVVMACERLLGVDTGVRTARLLSLAREVERRSGVLLAADAPLVGATTHWHESGIHVHGLLEEPSAYEPVAPGDVGLERRFVFGKHTGRAALSARARALGLSLDPAALGRALGRLKAARPAGYRSGIDQQLAARDAYLRDARGVPLSVVDALLRDVADEGTG